MKHGILVLLSLFLVPAFSLAQDNKSFDLSLTRLPQNYQGADFISLHQKYLSYSDRKKSEFETEAEYKKRLKNLKEVIQPFSRRMKLL